MERLRLEEVASELWQTDESGTSGKSARVVVKTDHLRQVLMTLRAGCALSEHHAPGPMSVVALSGAIRFSSGGETVRLEHGDLVSLGHREPHSVEAETDAVFLITIAPE